MLAELLRVTVIQVSGFVRFLITGRNDFRQSGQSLFPYMHNDFVSLVLLCR